MSDTMSDVQVVTPPSNSGPSPLTVAATENLKIRRAHLFAQIHHTDLLRGMNLQEQRYMTTSNHISCRLDLLTNLCPAPPPIG